MQGLNMPFKFLSGREVKREVRGAWQEQRRPRYCIQMFFDRFLRYMSFSEANAFMSQEGS